MTENFPYLGSYLGYRYDVLTHTWALKTTQNEFKWQHNVCKQRDVSYFRIALYGQVIHGCRYRWLISYMTPLSDGTPTHIHMHFIFLASRIISLNFPLMISVYLRSNFYGERHKTSISYGGRFCRSRSSKGDHEFGANQKRLRYAISY